MRISGVTYVPRKTHHGRKILVFIFILLLVSAFLVMLISGYNAWKILHPPRTAIPPFESNIAPPYKDASFSDIKGDVTLKGWYFQAKGSSRTLILAHSYGCNRLQFGIQTLDLIKGFLNKGYNVLAFDFRNSGSSSGKLSTLGYNERYDLLGAVKYAKSQGSEHIVIMGFATGASTALLAAAESDAKESKYIEAVIADSPFSDIKDFIYDGLRELSGLPAIPFNRATLWSLQLLSGTKPESASPLQAIEKIAPLPVLFIHSMDDTYTKAKDSEKLYSRYSVLAPVAAEIWKTEGATHAESYLNQSQKYMDKVLNFLETKVFDDRQ